MMSNIFQYFVEAGTIAVRRVRKEDLRHVAKANYGMLIHDKNWKKKILAELLFLRFCRSNAEDSI